MSLPFCHVMLLFNMAEKADQFDALTIFHANHVQYDEQALSRLQTLERSKFKSKTVFKKMVTEEAKQRAEQRMKSR